jgi:2-haloalkanoic acid dehalogenase type II
MKRLTDFWALSFDCYGTLIDWESGIRNALAGWKLRVGLPVGDDALVECFGRHEWVQQSETPGLRYPEILERVLRRMGTEWGVGVTGEEASAFGESVKSWPAFADSAPALGYLKKYHKLVILSNVDRESFRHSNAKLGVGFDCIFTAEDIGSYKPELRNFQYMLDRLAVLGIPKERILHTAESLYHDHLPAKQLGLCSAWIHRRHAQPGFGATRPPTGEVQVDFRYTSLAEMAEAHRKALHPVV